MQNNGYQNGGIQRPRDGFLPQSMPQLRQNKNPAAPGLTPGKPPRRKKKKSLKWFFVPIGCVLVVLISFSFFYTADLLGLIDRTEITGDPALGMEEFLGDEERFNEADDTNGMSQAAADFESIKDMPIAYSPKVYNILLIGCDSRGNNFSGRSDSMMIVSINQENGNIHITSLTRAMYVYIPGRDSFYMLNASYAWGGTKMLINTIETNFRVKIDDHMVVNFSCFKEVVDIAGGVDIQLTQAEARYLRYGSEGVHHMDGDQALTYSRLRHLDTDFKRTGRQRTVIEALFKKARSMDLVQLSDLARKMFPNINTSMTNAEIFSFATKLVATGDAPIDQIMLPNECNDEKNPYETRFFYNRMEMYRFNYRNNIRTLWTFIYECDDVSNVPTIPFEPRS